MTPLDFIEKAIKGGWRGYFERPEDFKTFKISDIARQIMGEFAIEEILLDPEAWKAVGKVEGWSSEEENPDLRGMQEWRHNQWKSYMHRMIDALAYGNTVGQYLETL